jgi:hypothetical protein
MLFVCVCVVKEGGGGALLGKFRKNSPPCPESLSREIGGYSYSLQKNIF